MATTAERLQKVRDAIDAILDKKLSGYSISTGGGSRSTSYLSLTELREMEKELVAELAQESRGGGVGVRLARPLR